MDIDYFVKFMKYYRFCDIFIPNPQIPNPKNTMKKDCVILLSVNLFRFHFDLLCFVVGKPKNWNIYIKLKHKNMNINIETKESPFIN